MSTGTVTVNGAQVPMELPDRNVINVTINQESSLAYLCKAAGQCLARQQKAASKAPKRSASVSSTRICSGGEQKVLGGVQILLGIVCVSLGAVIEYENVFYNYIRAGAAYWMGGLFVLSGILSVAAKRRGSCLVPVATFFNLVSVVAASVALTQGIASIPDLNSFYNWKSEVCRSRLELWGTTAGPGPSPGPSDWQEEQCKYMLWHLMAVAYSVRILLLIFSASALAVAFFCFGYGLSDLCYSLKASHEVYTELEDQEVPPPYENPGRPENIP